MLTAECFEVSGRIDISDWRNFFIKIQYFIELAIATLNFGKIGHIRHRTAGSEIWQYGDLFRAT